MSAAATPSDASRLPDAPLGLYEPGDFRLAKGEDAGEALSASARYLFAGELVALPVSGPHAGHAKATAPFADIRAWAASPGALTKPSMVWVASAERRAGARIAADGSACECDGLRAPLALAPRNPLNRSWADASTFAYLSRRGVTLRGHTAGDGSFVARTLWPEDWRMDYRAPVVKLATAPEPVLAIRGLMRNAPRGGAASPFATSTLWEREPGAREWAGRAVLGLMVNGAQGDDDEAWGGHFALLTGRLPADGRLSDLLVANFYSLDVHSEKGILAAPVPLDNYLADLNSGQAWYRPSYIVFAILRGDRVPSLVQGALNRLYLQFWRRQLRYQHSTMNCASISVDLLRALGWEVPARGPASRPLAWLSIPAMIYKDGKVSTARTTYEYLTEDRTRLMPAAAWEEAAVDLLRLAREGANGADGTLATMLAADIEALASVRVPQLPSSRPFGIWPVANPREYAGAIPHDPEDALVVPVPPRHFGDELLEPDLLAPARRRSTLPLLLWAITGVLPVAWIAGRLRRLLRGRRRSLNR